ncbi:MAG TPA: response regulator, partial [Phototrophicaceae bacterium]|nr:response regulator [Phototrophicaceae bacterium]
MATRVLILHRQLVFAVTIKQALEQTGLFDVHPFTTPDAAYDYLRDHPQDVALVDFTLPGQPGAQVVRQLRALQPDLAIVITPNQPEAVLLSVQGGIDMPFTARDFIPVIQQAVAQTGGEPPAPTMPQTKRAAENRTRLLDEPPPGPPQPFGEDAPPPVTPGQTRIFDDEPEKPAARPAPQTRQLDDPPAPTRKLAADPADPPARPVAQTRKLDDVPPPPVDLPEFSTLDRVLKSFDFEPLAGEEDTPPVPQRDSGAVRQYLATASDAEPQTFDEVLGAIEAQPPTTGKPERHTDFDDLVASLRGSAPHTPLPERQQQSLDFILTSGMDAVLKEIENAKTGAPPPQPPAPKSRSTFEKLAQEEPPMPPLEESGTVSDLIVGIGDRNFRNVLALLRGEEVEDSRTNRDSAPTRF